MADELLNAVIQLEAQIQQQLANERRRAATWLASIRDELELNKNRAADERKTVYRQACQEAERQAEELQKKHLSDVMGYCRKLEEIDDETLLEVLREELIKLVPEPSDDHQDGES